MSPENLYITINIINSIFTLICIVTICINITHAIRMLKDQKTTSDKDETTTTQTNNMDEWLEQNLINAKDMLQATKSPQLRKIVEEIHKTKDNGNTHAYISNSDLLQEETISTLLSIGYDIHILYYNSLNSFSTAIYWDNHANGRLTFNCQEAKTKANFAIAAKSNFDIEEERQI